MSIPFFVGPECILDFEEGFVLSLRNDEANVCCRANAYDQKHQETVLLQAKLWNKRKSQIIDLITIDSVSRKQLLKKINSFGLAVN